MPDNQTQALIAVIGFPVIHFLTGLVILWLQKRDLKRDAAHPSTPTETGKAAS